MNFLVPFIVQQASPPSSQKRSCRLDSFTSPRHLSYCYPSQPFLTRHPFSSSSFHRCMPSFCAAKANVRAHTTQLERMEVREHFAYELSLLSIMRHAKTLTPSHFYGKPAKNLRAKKFKSKNNTCPDLRESQASTSQHAEFFV